MKKIRIGILGCASIADRSVIPAIKSLPELFELVAVSSRSIDKAKDFAEKFDCSAIVGYENMINRTDIDALYIPLPTGLHFEWIQKALNAKKHIYAEKSIAMNYQEAKLMVDAARINGVALMEGYMFQYHSQHDFVKNLLKNGTIGEIRSFSASFGFPPLSGDNFRYDNSIGGGALMDCAGYVVRSAFFILNQPLKVKAATVYYNLKNTSLYGNAFMVGEQGLAASLSFGFDNYYQCNYQIWGNKGKITVQKAFTPKSTEKAALVLETNAGVENITLEADNHFVKAFKEFYSVITKDIKEKKYNEILEQSEALEKIKDLSLEI